MACYEHIVGLRGLCDGNAVRYYVDDWGISLKTSANIADERYGNGRRLFEAKRKQAWEYLLQDVVLRGYKHDQILKAFSIANPGGTTLAANGTIQMDFTDHCELTGVFIDSITVDVLTGGAATILVNGETVYSDTLATGFNTILIGKVYSKALTITITSATATVNGGKGDYYEDGKGGCYGVSETYGMAVTGDYRCSIEQYLCRFPDKIGMALAMKTAALLYKEMLNTTKLAEILFMRERSEIVTELASLDSDENLFKYDDKAFVGGQPIVASGKYQKQIEYINRVIPVPKCRCCMEAVRSSYHLVIP